MLKAFIHIGLEKTGTTTLQEFFALNRNVLLQKKIYYPTVPGDKNHIDLAAYSYDKTLGDILVQKDIKDESKRAAFRTEFKLNFDKEIAIAKKNKQHILVSSEHLSSRVFSKNEIRKLISLFTNHGYEIKIIIYLRRQDQYLLSTYSTYVKCGATSTINMNTYKRKRYDYLSLLNMWSEVVGQENMIVKIFERSRMYKNDLLMDFLKILNIEDFESFALPPKDLNKSLDNRKLNFLRIFNAYVPEISDGQKNPLRGQLVSLLEKLENQEKMVLQEELSALIIDYYKEDNEKIKADFFPDLDGSLFSYKIKKNNQPTVNEQSEDFFEIFGELWKSQQQEILELQKENNELIQSES